MDAALQPRVHMLVQEFVLCEFGCEEAAELGCGFGDRAGGCEGQDEGC